jgi:hypothetical protein
MCRNGTNRNALRCTIYLKPRRTNTYCSIGVEAQAPLTSVVMCLLRCMYNTLYNTYCSSCIEECLNVQRPENGTRVGNQLMMMMVIITNDNNDSVTGP